MLKSKSNRKETPL